MKSLSIACIIRYAQDWYRTSMTIPTGIVAGQCDLVAVAFCGSGFLAATLAAGKPLPQA